MASRPVVEAAFETVNGSGYLNSVSKSSGRQATPGKATILAIARALPGEAVSQEESIQRYLLSTGMDKNPDVVEKLDRLGKMTGVKTRYFSFTKDDIVNDHVEFVRPELPSIKERFLFSNKVVANLVLEASNKAIAEWGRSISEITHLVYVSSSEFRMPGGDLILSEALGLNSDVNRVMLYMLGCYGGATGMRIAKDLAENNPGSRILLVTADTVIPGFRVPNPSRPYDLVGAALFGEASSAVILGADPLPTIERPWFQIEWAGQTFVPGTKDVIHGVLTEGGIFIELGKELPNIIADNIEGLCKDVLKKAGKPAYGYDDVFWAVHPGGPAILNAMEKTLELRPEQLSTSRQVLADFGNVNSTTIIYVLDNMRKNTLKRREAKITGHPDDNEWGYIFSFGPGVTMESALARNLI